MMINQHSAQKPSQASMATSITALSANESIPSVSTNGTSPQVGIENMRIGNHWVDMFQHEDNPLPIQGWFPAYDMARILQSI
jgi:hypothetical protein